MSDESLVGQTWWFVRYERKSQQCPACRQPVKGPTEAVPVEGVVTRQYLDMFDGPGVEMVGIRPAGEKNVVVVRRSAIFASAEGANAQADAENKAMSAGVPSEGVH